MNLVLLGIAAYLTWYTFSYARQVWRDGHKAAGAAIMALSGCFLPLSVALTYM